MFQRPDSGQTHCNLIRMGADKAIVSGFNGLIAAKPNATPNGSSLCLSVRCFNGLIAAKPTATMAAAEKVLRKYAGFNGLIAAKPTATVIGKAKFALASLFQRPDSGQTHCNLNEGKLGEIFLKFQRPDSGQTHCNVNGSGFVWKRHRFQRPDSGQTHCNDQVKEVFIGHHRVSTA